MSAPTRIALFIAAVLIAGCATPPSSPPLAAIERLMVPNRISGDVRTSVDSAAHAAGAWWSVHFQSTWRPANGRPPWHLDTLIADRLIRPALERTGETVPLWRVHRRAAPDAAGHRLTLIYYASEITARSLNHELSTDPLVSQLRDAKLLADVVTDDLGAPRRSDVAATSDPAWPLAIQRSWPWFIMGISAHWLRLIDEVNHATLQTNPPAAAPSAPSTNDKATAQTLPSLLAHYGAVTATVDALWRDQGQHAYLHHLNAVFGYQPLVIREENLKRF